jgi:hypothetical protein
MRTDPYRIVIWGPGTIGSALVREIATRPEYQVVGSLCYSADKDGKDVGEIAGIGPIGVKSTRDKEAIFALQADVAIVAVKDSPDYSALDNDVVRLLESGKNVISPTSYVYPPMGGEAYAKRLLDACTKGNSSLHNCGEHPSMMCERIALTATGFANRLKHIRLHECTDLTLLKNPGMLQQAGIGMGANEFEQASGMLGKVWGPLYRDMAGFMANKLYGADASRVKTEYSASCTFAQEPFTVPDLLTVEKDGALCVNQLTKGWVDGQHFISLHNHWYFGPENAPFEEIKTPFHVIVEIEAEPVSVRLNLQCQASFAENRFYLENDDTLPVFYLAAIPILQAIPRVVDAPAGFVFQDAATYWQPDFRSLSQ